MRTQRVFFCTTTRVEIQRDSLPCTRCPQSSVQFIAVVPGKRRRYAMSSHSVTATPRENQHNGVNRAVRFRPCIDLHAGRVKQIVGSTLSDGDENLKTNFDTELSPRHFASMYARDNLPGGHVIMIGSGNEAAALDALSGFPSGLHIGGGINPHNAMQYLDAGASHVIVTSYVFRNGIVDWDRIHEMSRAVGQHRLVLDVSCKRRDGDWVVCTDRWRKWTDVVLCADTVGRLSDSCDELLVHAVDVEGMRAGMDEELISCLAHWSTVPVTYAGGVRSIEDLNTAKRVGQNRVDITIGSALDIFGGDLKYSDAVRWQREQEKMPHL